VTGPAAPAVPPGRLGDSWWQLLVAVYPAVVFGQISFLGHEAGHRQLFRSRRANDVAGLEGILLLAHFAGYLTAVIVLLSPLRAAAFVAVQQGLLGVYLGCAFAPNHKGMLVLGEQDSWASSAARC